jgi:lipopolysaccharide export system permease protein
MNFRQFHNNAEHGGKTLCFALYSIETILNTNGINVNKTERKKVIEHYNAQRTFVWLPRIDLYVLKEFLTPFSILIFAFLLLFLLGDLFDDLSDFLDSKTSTLAVGVRYFLLKIPGNIQFILPMTVLLSCMYTIANFGRHREITAMRASGISLFRCGGPIYIMAFLVMLVSYWFNESVIPQCNREAEFIQQFAKKGEAYKENLNSKLQYHSPDKVRSWFFGRFDNDGTQRNVKVKFFKREDKNDPDSKRVPDWMIEAKEAKYISGKGWEFKDYTKTEFFDGLPAKTIRQAGVKPYFISKEQAPEDPKTIEKTIVLPQDLPTSEIFHILRTNKKMAATLRNVYETLFYYRLAFPWICFFCSFLALPLAAKNERAGIFTAIVNGLAVVVIYQLLTELMLIAGKNGYLPPILAGTLPTILFMIYGWFYIIRKAG